MKETENPFTISRNKGVLRRVTRLAGLFALGACCSYIESIFWATRVPFPPHEEAFLPEEVARRLWLKYGGPSSLVSSDLTALPSSAFGWKEIDVAGIKGNVAFSGSVELDTHHIVIKQAGWPFYCVEGISYNLGLEVPDPPSIGIWEPGQKLFDLTGSELVEWPAKPMLIGLVLNALCHVLVFCAASSIVHGCARRLRSRKNQCRRCAHQLLVNQSRCPECGYMRQVQELRESETTETE